MTTKFIVEYRYQNDESKWLFDCEYATATEAHLALVEHVAEYKHIEVRVRKIETVETDEVVGHFKPISSEDYNDE